MQLDKLNRALMIPRAIVMTVTGGFSLATFLLLVNIIGSVVTDNTDGLTPVIRAAVIVGLITAVLFLLCWHCVGFAAKNGGRIELSTYFGNRTDLPEEDFVRIKGVGSVLAVITKKKKRYLFLLPPLPFGRKHFETIEKLFPFTEIDL